VFYRYDDAAALYLQALSVQPEFYPAYTRLATVRWELGHLAEAIRYAEKSIAIEPAVGWTRARLVWFYVVKALHSRATRKIQVAELHCLGCRRVGW